MVATDTKDHWNTIYSKTPPEKLGWYEKDHIQSLNLVNQCQLFPDSRIFIAGAGTTTLVDHLLDNGFAEITIADISGIALQSIKERVDQKHLDHLQFVESDLSKPMELCCLPPFDLWHDRAVLHFFTEKKDRDTYFNLVRKLTNVGGYVIIAVFHLEGATKCSGLPVYRYDAAMISEGLGHGFRLRETFLHDHKMPSGEVRKYVYGMWQRFG